MDEEIDPIEQTSVQRMASRMLAMVQVQISVQVHNPKCVQPHVADRRGLVHT
jgi:hypothetical protein